VVPATPGTEPGGHAPTALTAAVVAVRARLAWLCRSRLVARICRGVIGWNGTNRLAPSTLSMLPKWELAPMRTYLSSFPPETIRP
jgi:hypothetical protein